MSKITAKLYTLLNEQYTIADPVTFHFTACRDDICDKITADFLYPHTSVDFTTAQFYIDDTLILDGYVDSTSSVYDKKGQHLHVTCRNQYAPLVDNEPPPGNRASLTTNQLYTQFGQAGGLKGILFTGSPTVLDFDVKDTQSFWDVINNFCLRAFLKDAWINPQGYAVETVGTGKTVQFSNTIHNAVPYIYASIGKKRKGLVYTATSSVRNSLYNFMSRDSDVKAMGIETQKYFSAESFWNEDTGFDASRAFLNRQKKDMLQIQIQSPGFQLNRVGDAALYQDGNFYIDGIYIYKIEWIQDTNHQFTRYLLYKNP